MSRRSHCLLWLLLKRSPHAAAPLLKMSQLMLNLTTEWGYRKAEGAVEAPSAVFRY
jgi:hypothetical protein